MCNPRNFIICCITVAFATNILWILLNHVFEDLNCRFSTPSWCIWRHLPGAAKWILCGFEPKSMKSNAFVIGWCDTSYQWLLCTILWVQTQKLPRIHNCVKFWAGTITTSSVLQLQFMHKQFCCCGYRIDHKVYHGALYHQQQKCNSKFYWYILLF